MTKKEFLREKLYLSATIVNFDNFCFEICENDVYEWLDKYYKDLDTIDNPDALLSFEQELKEKISERIDDMKVRRRKDIGPEEGYSYNRFYDFITEHQFGVESIKYNDDDDPEDDLNKRIIQEHGWLYYINEQAFEKKITTENEAASGLLQALQESMECRMKYIDAFNTITEENQFLIDCLAECGDSMTDVESLEQLLNTLQETMHLQDRYSDELGLLDKENQLLTDLVVRKKLAAKVEARRKQLKRERKNASD